jgi:outer membrane protein insertion porin family
MGGNSLVRGYKPYKLGPVYRGTHIPEGGISQQLYSAEYNYNFSKKVDGFLFLDGGHLSKKYWDVTSNRVRWAYGIGMRLELLASLPPISFGFGFPINPKRHDRKMFFIQFGVKF